MPSLTKPFTFIVKWTSGGIITPLMRRTSEARAASCSPRADEAAAAADAAAAPSVRRRQLALQAPALASAVRQCIIMAKGRAKTRLCMSYDELLRRLAQAGACQAASAAEVASRLDALAAAVPQWFSLRALPSGERVVAIENGVDFDALTKELAAAAAAADGV